MFGALRVVASGSGGSLKLFFATTTRPAHQDDENDIAKKKRHSDRDLTNNKKQIYIIYACIYIYWYGNRQFILAFTLGRREGGRPNECSMHSPHTQDNASIAERKSFPCTARLSHCLTHINTRSCVGGSVGLG